MTNLTTPVQGCLACGRPEADHKIVSDQCVEIDCRCEVFAQLDLDEMQRLADAATPGPWERQETMHADNHVTAGGGVLTGTHVCGPTYERHNALFIAAARDAVPALIRRVRELEAALSPSTSAHLSDEHHDAEERVLHYGRTVRNGVHTDRPDGFTDVEWHLSAMADTGTSHNRPGRLYIVQCEWCPKAFAAETKVEAMEMFRAHEQEIQEGSE